MQFKFNWLITLWRNSRVWVHARVISYSRFNRVWLPALLLCLPVNLPAGEQDSEVWWPSVWGKDDQAGASNLIDTKTVLAATRLIRKGEIIELGRVYEVGMPLKFGRVYAHRTSPAVGPIGKSRLVDRNEFLCTEIGQVGTQVDGLAHVSVETSSSPVERRLYNGFLEKDIITPHGFTKLGIEKMKPLFTRGILIDIARSKGRMLSVGEEITVKDMKEALKQQKMSTADIQEGDVVLFNTGWGRLWMVDNERFNSGAPGIGMELANWLIEKNIVLVGSDTWNTEWQPSPETEEYPVHNELLTKNGIYIQENLQLEELSAKDVFEFAYVFNRVPLKGASGSPGSPLAIW